jgi:hypothetical protein
MRLTLLILFYIVQVVLGLTFLYLTYLLTYTVDFFAWGSSKADRFFLIVLPLALIPTIVVVSIFKFFVTMRLQTPLQLTPGYKWSFILPIASGLICHFLLGLGTTWFTILVSGTMTIAIVIETFGLSRRLLWIGK